jgi:ABC-type multidrug transport system fused ATPase/permease subunit
LTQIKYITVHEVGLIEDCGPHTEMPRLQQLFDVLDTAAAVRDRPNATDLGRLRGRVEFEGVSFSYQGKRPPVTDFAFMVSSGWAITFVGATRVGALALLSGFDPQATRIRIDGTDIRDMTLVALRCNIGVVFQDGLLFDRSMTENLRIGRLEASVDELRLAIGHSQALELVESGCRTLDTRVGERGRLLFGVRSSGRRLRALSRLQASGRSPHSFRGGCRSLPSAEPPDRRDCSARRRDPSVSRAVPANVAGRRPKHCTSAPVGRGA